MDSCRIGIQQPTFHVNRDYTVSRLRLQNRPWRVTLKSIHPKELTIMPQKDVKMMDKLIQEILPTYGIVAVELSKSEIKYFSQVLLQEGNDVL